MFGDRLTDFLNGQDRFHIHKVIFESLDDGHLVAEDSVSITRDDLLAVIASGPRGSEAQRVELAETRMQLSIGPYLILGRVHTAPGADPVSSVMQREPMVPLTDATIAYDVAGNVVARDVGRHRQPQARGLDRRRPPRRDGLPGVDGALAVHAPGCSRTSPARPGSDQPGSADRRPARTSAVRGLRHPDVVQAEALLPGAGGRPVQRSMTWRPITGPCLNAVAGAAAGDPDVVEVGVPVDDEVRVGRRLVLADPGLDDRRVGEAGEALGEVAAGEPHALGIDEPLAVVGSKTGP